MNSATQNLEQDHTYILRLIDVMEIMTQNKTFDAEDVESVIYLIKNYADGFHHEKEEQMLFPLMATKGFSMSNGPLAVMLHDHEQGRNYVKGMVEGIEQLRNGSEMAYTTIRDNMTGYISLLRGHIYKENNVLFRMADNLFTEADHEKLLKDYQKVEKSKICGSILSGYIEAIEQMEHKYEQEISKL